MVTVEFQGVALSVKTPVWLTIPLARLLQKKSEYYELIYKAVYANRPRQKKACVLACLHDESLMGI